MSNAEILTTLKGASMSEQDIKFLIRGQVPPWRPSKQSEALAVKRAEAILGREKALEIRRRFTQAKRIELEE